MKHFTQRIMKHPSQKIKKDSDAFFLNQKAGFNPGPIENQFEEPSLMTAMLKQPVDAGAASSEPLGD